MERCVLITLKSSTKIKTDSKIYKYLTYLCVQVTSNLKYNVVLSDLFSPLWTTSYFFISHLFHRSSVKSHLELSITSLSVRNLLARR